MRMNTEDIAHVDMDGSELTDDPSFKYLGSMTTKDADCQKDVTSRIGKGLMKWRSLTGVMCDKKMPNKLKGKVYRSIIRPVMMYAGETWALRKTQEHQIDVAEMKMLRWSMGISRKERIRNEHVRKQMGVRPISEKIQGARLRWFGHIERRDENYVGKVAANIHIDGKRNRGRPRTSWRSTVCKDLKQLGIEAELALKRKQWREETLMADPKSTGTTSTTK